MPTYQYACKDCDYHFEQVQAFTDPSLTVCPNCQGSLRKVYGSVGVVFKGSGFYRTDSRSGSSSVPAAHTNESSSASSDSGSKPVADAKPTAKPAPAAASVAPAKTPAAAAS